MLTKKQYELLMFIHERVRETGVPPSFDEMKEALDLRSKSGIHRLITALEERGFIRRLEKRARALEIVKLPDNSSDGVRPAATRTQAQRLVHGQPAPRGVRSEGPTNRIPANPRQAVIVPRRESAPDGNAISVPLIGRIAAGTPIEALQNATAEIPIPASMLSGGEHYALEVTGDSMIQAGILDGDTVIIKKADSANTGDIVVALVDEAEATLKRLRRRGEIGRAHV